MTIWPFVLLVIIAAFIIWYVYRRSASPQKQLAEIRENWGKPLEKYRNVKMVSAYLKLSADERNISAETAADLDLENVFAYIDRTSSKPGEQLLYQKLYTLQTSAQYFAGVEQEIHTFGHDAGKRERTQLKLASLNHADSYYLTGLFSSPQQSLFSGLAEFYIQVSAIVIVALSVLLFILPNQVYFFLLVSMLIANMVIHFSSKVKVLPYTRSLPQLLLLYDAGNWIFKEYALNNEGLKESLTNLSKLKKSLSILKLQAVTANDPSDILFLLIEWLNILLLIEPLVFLTSINKVNKYLAHIRAVYEFVAQADVAISIQSVREGLSYYCRPNFSATTNSLNIQDLYHPLVDGCVPNSITSNNSQGVLITGSNMSGKTTFIRAIGINTLLAQTIHTCCARVYEVPPLKLLTSIQINDDINTHKSYFQAEALSVLNILASTTSAEPVKSLIIIDEIFRGTNTIERVAAAKAVLSYLIANQNFVFVSTHDLELAKLLGEEYAVYSFEELLGNKRLVFDYKIKKGLLKNKNGIAVLQGMGYPQSVIADANEVSKQLRAKYEL